MVVMAAMAMAGLGGCASRCHEVVEIPYWQVVTMDVEGCWIAQYIAEGDVTKTCNGYRFVAMQRRIFQPVTLTFKYPLGRTVKVEAPNIVVTPTCKPLWLQELERYTVTPDQCKQTVGCRKVYSRQSRY